MAAHIRSGARISRASLRHVCAMVATLTATLLALVGTAPPAAGDEVRDRQWHLGFLDIAQAHQTTRGNDVTVAVVDTGVQASHPDLDGNVLEGTDLETGGDGQTEKDGHGTRIANVIAGHGHGNGDGVLGISPEAKILPVGVELHAESEQTAQGIRWAVDQGADVINLSLGHSDDNPSLREAVAYAQTHGVVLVASVGNTFDGDYIVHYPAAYPGVVAVSAIGKTGEFAPDVSVQGEEVDLAAPGEEISTGDAKGYGISKGTSDAAAIVSGAAALVRAEHPDLDAANVINRLVATATDQGPDGRDPQYGLGIINPVQALTANVPQVDENPLGSLAEETTQPTTTATGTPPGQAAPADGDDTNTTLLIAAIAIGVLALALVVTTAVVLVRNRRRPTAAPTLGPRPPPGPYPPPGQPPPPYQSPPGGPPQHPPPHWPPPPPGQR